MHHTPAGMKTEHQEHARSAWAVNHLLRAQSSCLQEYSACTVNHLLRAQSSRLQEDGARVANHPDD